MDESDGASISPLTTWSFPSSIHDLAFVSSQEELRALLFTTAQMPISTKRNSYVAPTNDEGDEGDEGGTSGTVDSHRTPLQIGQILATDRRLEYLKNYVDRVAPWLDMFDSRRAFGIQILAFIRESPALLYAVLAVSARQLELQGGIRNTLGSLELYQETIRLLKPLLQQRDQDAIVVCVILCCMEMMSASGEDWRRHLDGCAALFGSFNVNGFSGGLLRALFWCYARMDLCGALMSDGTQCTLIEPNKWLPAGTREEEVRDLFAQSHSPDMHANYAVYLCAKVTELIADRTNYVEVGEENGCTDEEYAERWMKLWDSLRRWLNNRPEELLPVYTIPSDPFPQILFVHWAAISSNQLHHTACLLLLGMTPKQIKLEAGEANGAQSYAKRICGISLTNPHEGCLNNAIQPLWIAGRYLSHRTEHALLVKLFRTIEQSTGWVTSWRVADLEHTWGYKIRTS